jgi:hypothetical protein
LLELEGYRRGDVTEVIIGTWVVRRAAQSGSPQSEIFRCDALEGRARPLG